MKKKICQVSFFFLLIFTLPFFQAAAAEKVLAAAPAKALTGYENMGYTFRTIDEKDISTKAVPTQTTLLVFGRTTCPRTTATLRNIAASTWIGRSDIRVIFGECGFASKEAVSSYAQQIGSSKIAFCYDEQGDTIQNVLFRYFRLFQDDPYVQLPLTVLIDKNDRVQKIWQETQTADELLKGIERYTATPTIANVSGLRASSDTKAIKLSWKKVPQAEGYIIYQYKNKKWSRAATVTSGKTSCVIQGSNPGTGHRFGIKAYLTQNGKQILSRSYTSLYTSTKPSAVNFKMAAGHKKTTLRWDKVKGASGYTVLYKTSSKAPWKTLKKIKGTSFTKKGLKPGKTYTFTVKAYKTYKGKTYTSSYKAKKVTIK